MADAQELAARVRALAETNGLSPATLSRKLFGNGTRLSEIEAGGSLTLSTYRKAMAMLDEMEQAA